MPRKGTPPRCDYCGRKQPKRMLCLLCLALRRFLARVHRKRRDDRPAIRLYRVREEGR